MRIVLPILSFLVLASCMSLEYSEISSRKTIYIHGVESKPPQQGIWLLAADTPTSMNFMQEFGEDDYIVAHAQSYELPNYQTQADFFEHVEISSGEVTRTPLNGVLCFKAVTISTEPKRWDGDSEEKLMKFMSYKCLHPDLEGVVVYMAYSLKHDPELDYPEFIDDAENFFANIVFTGT